MSRTRRIAAAGILAAALLAVFVGMLLTPTLHTQTPVSTNPPANGGTNTGGGTASACNATSDDHETDDQNETDVSASSVHVLDDNQTNETGGHGDECGASGDDQAGNSSLEDDALAFAQLAAGWPATVWQDLVSLSGSLIGAAAGSAPSGTLA